LKEYDDLHELVSGARSMLEAMADEVVVVDPQFTVVWFNAAKKQHFSSLELGAKCYRVFEKRGTICEQCPVEEAMQTGKPCRQTDRTKTENGCDWYGHVFVNDISACPLRNSKGQIIGCIEVVRDTSESYRIRRELASLTEEMKSVLHVLSHDLISPLVSIQGFVNKLEKHFGVHFDSRGQHYICRINENVAFMDSLVKSLLDTSRIMRQELHVREVDMKQLVDDILPQLEVTLQARKGKINVASPLPMAYCDPIRMGQVLLNLMGNSIKFTPEDQPPSITVGYSNGSYYVEDNGPGIEPSCADKIFQPFWRASAREIPGLGMGLHITKEILHKHRGKVWLDKSYTGGARFRFTLPTV